MTAEQPRQSGARSGRRFEHFRIIRPSKALSIAAAAREELKVAAPGEGEFVGKRLVQVALEHIAANQHAAGAVDHLDAAGLITARLIEIRAGEPAIRPIEDRE